MWWCYRLGTVMVASKVNKEAVVGVQMSLCSTVSVPVATLQGVTIAGVSREASLALSPLQKLFPALPPDGWSWLGAHLMGPVLNWCHWECFCAEEEEEALIALLSGNQLGHKVKN